jgi:hypothetical protein
MIDVTAVRQRYLALSLHLDERARRIFAATEARTAGYGGIAAVSRATGIAASTIGRGLVELSATKPLAPERVRRPGGGGKTLLKKDATLLADLLAMVEPDARGDPMSPLRWTCKSLSQLAGAWWPGSQDWTVRRRRTVASTEVQPASQPQDARGESHPDRDAQFTHLNASVRDALTYGEPVISVDTKKKELVGDFKNAGRMAPEREPKKSGCAAF